MNDRNQWDDRNRGSGGDRDDDQQGYGRSGRPSYGANQQSQQDWRNREQGQQSNPYRGQQSSQDWGGGRQQGAWHDDDRRQGDYAGGEWRGERDWGNPNYGSGSGQGSSGQQNQREWGGGGDGSFNRGSFGSTGFTSGSEGRFGGGSAGYGGGDGGQGDYRGQGDYGYAERAWGGSSDRFGARPTSSGSMHRDEIGHADSVNRRGGDSSRDQESTRLRQDREMRAREQGWYSRDDTGRPGSQSFAAGYGMSSGPNYDQWGTREQRSFGHSGGSNPTFGRGYGPDYGREEGRGFFERAADEVASWFGNDEAARRREEDYRGHGPSDYSRSDDRIREDVNDRLTDDPRVDARQISVQVQDGEVTLTGKVTSREAKRRAEDCIDRISGVKHVQNNLRVEQQQGFGGTGAYAGHSTGTAGTASTSGFAGSGGTGSGAGASGATGTSASGTSGSAATTGGTGTTVGSGASSATGSTTGAVGSTGSTGTTSDTGSASKGKQT